MSLVHSIVRKKDQYVISAFMPELKALIGHSCNKFVFKYIGTTALCFPQAINAFLNAIALEFLICLT